MEDYIDGDELLKIPDHVIIKLQQRDLNQYCDIVNQKDKEIKELKRKLSQDIKVLRATKKEQVFIEMRQEINRLKKSNRDLVHQLSLLKNKNEGSY